VKVRYQRLAALSCALLLASAGCESTSELTLPTSPGASENVELTGLTWVFGWTTDGVSLNDKGWSTTNASGTTFTVESGWLSSYSAEFVPCVPSEQEGPLEIEASPVWAKRNVLERVLGIGRALADHGVDPDPSALQGPIIEDLGRLTARREAPLAIEPTTYCALHYLVAQEGSSNAQNGVTLRLTGTWSKGEQGGSLDVAGAYNYGALLELNELRASSFGPGAVVVLRRSPALLFEGVNPTEMSPSELAWKVTENIVTSSKIDIHEAEITRSE